MNKPIFETFSVARRACCLRSALLMVCIFFSVAKQGDAQTFHFTPEPYADSIALKTVVSNSGSSSIHPKYTGFPVTGTLNFTTKSVLALVALKVDVKSLQVAQGKKKFTYLIAYSGFGYPNIAQDNYKVPIPTDTLSISYDQDSLALINDHSFKVLGNFYKADINIDYVVEIVNGAPLVPAAATVPPYISVQGHIKLQKFSNYNPNNISSNDINVTDSIINNGTVHLDWTNNLGWVKPAGYEVEWTYALLGETRYNFRANATRIFTNNTFFNIPVAQKQGGLVWRVRMVRPTLANLLSRTYGEWTLSDEEGSLSNLGNKHIIISHSANDSVNWDLKMSFVEDGKYKQVITYYDGLLKQKQVQTRFNALPNQTIVAQSLLDYEGRPVISSLPIPVSNKTKFGYVPYFLSPAGSGGNKEYNKITYDSLPNTTACPVKEIAVPPLDAAATGNQYYSRQNPDRTGKNAFIPDAEGYPFTRRILAAENPEKVLFEGGAGAPLQLGKDRHTAYLYGVPLQAELNRYFGQDIGVYNHYRKRVTTDGHSQDGFSITNKEGKPVITGLIGVPDTFNFALSVKNAPVAKNFKSNLLPIPNKRVGLNWLKSGTHFVELETNYSTAYSIEYVPFKPCPSGLGLSTRVYFDYEIIDECGNVKIAAGGHLGAIGTTSSSLLTASKSDGKPLQKGNHVWNKHSYIKTEDIVTSVDAYLESSPNSNCIHNFDKFLKDEFDSTKFPCPPAGNPCADLRRAMIKELYPNSKYGKYIYTDSATKAFAGPAPLGTSIFSLHPDSNLPYLYQAGCIISDAQVNYKGTTYNLQTISPQILIEAFNDEIGAALLPLHPDFCKLDKCKLINNGYCQKLGSIKKAEQAYIIGPFEMGYIIDNDPLANTPSNPDGLLIPQELSHTLQDELIDDLAFRKTICGSDWGAVEVTCNDLYSDKDHNEITYYSAAMKDAYYQNLIALYTANREKRIGEYLRKLSNHCGTCGNLRLVNPNADNNANAPDSATLLASAIDSTRINLGLNASPSGNSFVDQNAAFTQDDLDAFHNVDNSVYCTAQVTSIMNSLANCSMNVDTLNRLRDTLTARFCTRDRRTLSQLTAGEFASILVELDIEQSDLCNTGLVNLWKTGNRSGSQVQLGFLQYSPVYYQNLEAFLETQAGVLNFIASGTASKTVQLRLCDEFPFEQALAQQLGISLQPGNCNAVSNPVTITQTVLSSSNTVKLAFSYTGTTLTTLDYYLYPTTNTYTNALSSTFGTTAISNMTNYKVAPVFNLHGFDQVEPTYANRNTLLLRFTGTLNAVQQPFTYILSAFGPKIDYLAVEPDAPQYLNGVGCSELLPMVRETINAADRVGIKAGHPFFETFFENTTNYNNRVHFSYESYEVAIRSCGLTDSLLIPKHMAHFEVQFTSGYNLEAYLDSVQNADTLNLTLVHAYNLNDTKHLLLEIDPAGTRNVKEAHQILFSRLPDGLSSSVRYLPSFGRDTVAQLLSSSWASIDADSLADAFPEVSVYTEYIDIEYYIPGYSTLPGQSLFPSPDSKLITLRLKETLTNNYEYNHLTDTICKYVARVASATPLFTHAESAVSAQYNDGQMKAWREYVHTLNAGNHNGVVKGSKSNTIGALPSLLSPASYESVRYPLYRNDLYIANEPLTANGNFNYIQGLLNAVNGNNGSGLLREITTPVSLQFSPNGAGGATRAYVCSDTSVFWINHFDSHNKMYNIFIKLPQHLFLPRTDYTLQSVAKGFERDSVTHLLLTLTAQLPNGSSSQDTIVCPAFCNRSMGTDYIIPTAFLSSYNDNNAYAPFRALSCEQAKIKSLYPGARIRYNLYRDSLRTSLIGRFQQHMIDTLVEKLDLSGIDIKHGLTLYYYDVVGNLIRTVSPEGVGELSVIDTDNDDINTARKNNNSTNPKVPAHSKKTEYFYNAQNKVIKTTSPDAGEGRTYYDVMGRVTFSQDAQQIQDNTGVYFIYDKLSRVVESGLITAGSLPWTPDIYTTLGNIRANVIQSQYRKEVSVTLYDTATYGNLQGTFTAMPLQDNLKNRVACAKYFEVAPDGYKTLEDTAYDHALHYSYDLNGNVKTLVHDYRSLLRPELRLKRVDYEYDLYSGKVLLVAYNRGGADGFYQRYKYDADNRITEASSSAEGIFWDLDAHYDYYDHGPLARTSLGNQRVQGVDYAYTINGWLKAVNGTQNGPKEDIGKDGGIGEVMPRDVVSQRIDYFKRDYRAIGNDDPTPNVYVDSVFLGQVPSASKDLYNGNIGGLAVSVAPFKNLYSSYRYDPLQRIETARYQEYNYNNQPATLTVQPHMPDWSTDYRYDKDGNLKKLDRRGNTLVAGQQPIMDSLVYNYSGVTNRLYNLQDLASTTAYGTDIPASGNSYNINSIHYTYDAAGRLKTDKISGLDPVTWNRWSKVKSITKKPVVSGISNTLYFTYDAMGNRLSKEEVLVPVKDSQSKRRTIYVRDAAGNVLAVYENQRNYNTTGGNGRLPLPDLAPYPGPPSGPYPLPPTRYPAAWLHAVAGNLLQDLQDNPSKDLALLAMEIPTLHQYSSNQELVKGLIDGLSAPQTVSLVRSMPLIAHYALGGADPDLYTEEETPPPSAPVMPETYMRYLEPVLAGSSAMATHQGALLAALKSGNRPLYDATVASVPVSGEVKEGFPASDGGALLEALAGMEAAERINMTNELAYALGGMQENSLLLSRVRAALVGAFSMPNNDFVQQVPSADIITEQLRNDARNYVEHRFALATAQMLQPDSVAAPFANNGVLATALYANNANGNQTPTQEVLSTVLNNFLPQLQNAADAAGKTTDLNTALLKVNTNADAPVLVAWFQKTEVLKQDKTYLAEHHIYGSSRLGIQRYLPGQKAYDAISPMVAGSGLQPLVQKRAWYSLWGDDLFAIPTYNSQTGQSMPMGTLALGFEGLGPQSHILGLRHYELTNHLGNVQATVLDRVTPIIGTSPATGDTVGGYSADISSAQDYYPFGMLMPGRHIADATPHCITANLTTLVPRKTRVYLIIEAPPIKTKGGPIVATPYPWGPVSQLPYASSFISQKAYFNHYLPESEHEAGWAARVIPGGGGYELDLSGEPSGVSMYLPFKADTASGPGQVLGFEVGQLPAGVHLEARVRQYTPNGEEYTEVAHWRQLQQGEPVEMRFSTTLGGSEKLVGEFRFTTEGNSAPSFGSAKMVAINGPWIEKTEWATESRLVTLCDQKDNYRYGFNGMEKDNEVKGLGNSLDFGARIYDPRIGRWLSLDPLANKYPSLSPYNFTGNNPILFVDPDGKKIVVYDKGKAYQYTPGVKPTPGSPDVLFKVHEAASYAMQTKTGSKVWTTVGSSERVVNINFKDATITDRSTNEFRPFNISGRNESETKLGDVDWDYNSRVKVSGGWQDIEGSGVQSGYISPSTVLLHELGHVYLMEKALNKGLNSKEWSNYKSDTNKDIGFDEKYDTKDERTNTEEIERSYINEINEIEGKDGSYQRPRYNHQGDIDHRNNDSDVNKNPSKSEQQKEFNSPY